MWRVLRTPGVARLLITSLVGRAPQVMSAVALVRLVVDERGDFGLAAAVVSVFTIAGTVGQPMLARAVDRTGRPRLVVGAAALVTTGALVVAAVSVAAVPLATVLAAAVAGLATPPLEPAMRALWPRLVTPERVGTAYALDAAAQEVAFIAGPLIAALGIALTGAVGDVVAMAALGALGCAAFLASPRLGSRPPAPTGTTRHGSPLAGGAFRRLLLLVLCAGVPIGALTITAIAWAGAAGAPALGPVAIAVNAGGALVGALTTAARPFRRSASALLRPLTMVLALLYLPTAAIGAPAPIWLAAAFASGLALPPLLTQAFGETPRLVRDSHATEGAAWVVSMFSVGIAAGTLVAGLLVGGLGAATGVPVAVLVASAVAALGAALPIPRSNDGVRDERRSEIGV